MGLFSSPRVSMRVLVMCLGSWGVLQCSVVAQGDIIGNAITVESPDTGAYVDEVNTPIHLDGSKWEGSKNSEIFPVNLAGYDARSCQCQKQPPDKALRLQTDSDESLNITLDVKETDDDEAEPTNSQPTDTVESDSFIDDELGILRVRSQPVGLDSELGRLRILPIDELPVESEPEPTRQTSVFLTGRSNVYGGNNLFRTPNPIDDRIYQVGVGIFAFPRLTDKTNLVLSAETNLARYEDLSVVDYNELQFQAGIRQRLGGRSYGQLNWRYQDLSTPGSDSFFTANYVELLLSRRDILNNRTWLDAYYQARLSISDPEEFSRFSQIATGSLNYGFDPKTRVSLLYQLFLDDYTQTSRYDTHHQLLTQVSHDLSSTTRISVFTGFRFGRSSRSNINFDDTIYGASINVNLPLF